MGKELFIGGYNFVMSQMKKVSIERERNQIGEAEKGNVKARKRCEVA